MEQPPLASKPMPVTTEKLPQLEKVEVDINIRQKLPQGSMIKSAAAYGASYWTQTARIDVELASGAPKVYFLKLATGHSGFEMVRGEYTSMKALYDISPDFVPHPVGYGTYERDSDLHFFLCDFINMADKLPETVVFCKALADLHTRSQALSPNGMYGFEMTTYHASLPQDNTWNVSWEAFFARGLKHMIAIEEDVHGGGSPEIQALLPALFEKVIPRLLRPLETGGNSIKPSLVHGDLWDGNAAVDSATDEPYIFDSSAFWAHNEYDLSSWRAARFTMRKAYVDEYFKHIDVSIPEEDRDYRNLLYALRIDICVSALHPGQPRFRQLVLTSLKTLVEAFPNGYEGTEPMKGSEK